IAGTVTDQSGAVIPGAVVSALNTDTGVVRTASSNQVGEYRLGFLIPGHYSVTAEAQGFKKATTRDALLTVGQLMRVDFDMVIGTVTEEITVAARAAPLNVDSAAVGDIISEKAIQNLPLNGREWIGLATLVPGVSSGSPKTGMVYSKGYSIAINGAR